MGSHCFVAIPDSVIPRLTGITTGTSGIEGNSMLQQHFAPPGSPIRHRMDVPR